MFVIYSCRCLGLAVQNGTTDAHSSLNNQLWKIHHDSLMTNHHIYYYHILTNDLAAQHCVVIDTARTMTSKLKHQLEKK